MRMSEEAIAEMMEREHRIQVDDRVLDVVEAGAEGGPAIIVHHGTPGSRLLYAPWVENAESLGMRVVGYSRPGYGASTRRHGRNVAQCAEDVTAIADALGLDRFATWGISGGGPHVLATAALLPDRVVAAASLASVAPYDSPGLDFLAGMGEDNIVEFNAALEGEEVITPIADSQVPAMVSADPQQIAAQMKSVLSPVDLEVLSDEFGAFLARYSQHGLAPGSAGWVDDDLAFTRPWGFALADIRAPLQVWQGGADLMVPPAHGAWLASQLPDADFRFHPGDGHLALAVNRVPEVQAWLASQF